MRLFILIISFALLSLHAALSRNCRGSTKKTAPCNIGCGGTSCTDHVIAAASDCPYSDLADGICFDPISGVDPICEHQSNGKCGWTPTEALQDCLAYPYGILNALEDENE